MIVEKRISFRRLLLIIWKRLIAMAVLATVIVVPIVYLNFGAYTLDMTTPLILGTAIAIFLGFRTNSAYDRWFEGRSKWGRIRAMSRNLSMVLTRNNEAYLNIKTGKVSKLAPVVMERMIRRNIAWIWVLGRQLKGLPPFENVKHLLSDEDFEEVKDAHNPALKLLFLQSRDFRIAQSEGQFYDGEHFEIVAILRELVTQQTGCEGLKNTPFPAHYSFFTNVFIWLLLTLLSISLPGLENVSYFAIPGVVLIGWTFFMVEGIGSYMQDPFDNNRNVIPMDALARSTEIDLKSLALGDTDIPAPIQPIDGALY